jgi:hypothetical protein
MPSHPKIPAPLPAPLLARSKRKSPPYPFVLEALAPLQPEVRPMFSGYAVYIGDKIVFMLRDSPKIPEDNGLWLVFAEQTEAALALTNKPKSLHKKIPSLRTIGILGGVIKHWLLIPSDGPNFESEAQAACDLILAHDPRIGRIPESRRARIPKKR